MDFYSNERFKNWINKIKETKTNNESEFLNVFDYMMEDLVVACLNIFSAVKRREITKKVARDELEKIEKIIESSDVRFDDPLKDEMFKGVKEGLKAIVYSAKFYLDGKVSRKDFKALLNEAIRKEKEGKTEEALNAIARMGAKVFKGERLPDNLEIPESENIINWLDGIDVINTVLILGEIDSQKLE